MHSLTTYSVSETILGILQSLACSNTKPKDTYHHPIPEREETDAPRAHYVAQGGIDGKVQNWDWRFTCLSSKAFFLHSHPLSGQLIFTSLQVETSTVDFTWPSVVGARNFTKWVEEFPCFMKVSGEGGASFLPLFFLMGPLRVREVLKWYLDRDSWLCNSAWDTPFITTCQVLC